jgi:hypothetical protein
MSKHSLLCVMMLCAVSLKADTLRLRNGTTIEGKFVSGTEKGIWFARGAEGMALYPLSFVENLTFSTFTPYSKNQEHHEDKSIKWPSRTPGWPRADIATVRWPANSFR